MLAAINSPATGTVGLVRNDGAVDYGSPRDSKGKVGSEQRIDLGDLDALNAGNVPGFDSSNVVYHETIEAIQIQILGRDPETAHMYANSVAPGLVIESTIYTPETGDVTGTLSTLRVGKSNIRFTQESTFRTAIPENKLPTFNKKDENKANKEKTIWRASNPLDIKRVAPKK